MENPYVDSEGRPVVAATRATGSLEGDLTRLLGALGGLQGLLSPEHRILLKPNINSYHDAPAAVDLPFLAAFIDLLQARGFTKLTVAEGSGNEWNPTAGVIEKKGLLPVLEERGVPFINLEKLPEKDWEQVETGGHYLPRVHLPRLLRDFDRIIYLPNLKTHRNAGFTGTLKLSMGLTPLKDRGLFHRESTPGAVADLARVVRPHLSVVDGRTAFVADGPTFGRRVEPGVLLASGDPVACDIEAARILLQWGAAGHLGVHDPYDTEQIKQVDFIAPDGLTVRWV